MSTDIRAAQDAVERFMMAGGQGVKVVPHLPDSATLYRRGEMLAEEVHELITAGHDGDMVGYADAVADVIYVALGAATEAGIEIEPILEFVIEANNSKIDWDRNLPWATHPNGKIAKDEHFVAPEPRIEAELYRQGWQE